jgi:hypothetical protein
MKNNSNIFTKESALELANLYQNWKNQVTDLENQSIEQKEMFNEFMTIVMYTLDFEDDFCGDDEYLRAPYDFYRGYNAFGPACLKLLKELSHGK